jgi:hypothetical protein
MGARRRTLAGRRRGLRRWLGCPVRGRVAGLAAAPGSGGSGPGQRWGPYGRGIKAAHELADRAGRGQPSQEARAREQPARRRSGYAGPTAGDDRAVRAVRAMVGVAARLPGRRGRASSWQCAARHGRPARAFRQAHLRLQRCDRPRSVQAAVGGDLSGQRGAASGRRRRRRPRGGRKPWSPRSPPLHPGRGPPSPRPAPGPRDARNRPGQAHLPLGQPQYPVQPDPAATTRPAARPARRRIPEPLTGCSASLKR